MRNESHLLVISSEFRQNPERTTTSQFSVNFGNQSLYIYGYSIKQLTIPNSQTNINNNNNKFSISIANIPVERVITVPIGQYTTNTLLTYLDAQLKIINSNLSISQNSLTQKITVESSDNTSSGIFTINIGANSTLNKVLGYSPYQRLTGASVTAVNIIALNGVYNVFVLSRALTQANGIYGMVTDGTRLPIVTECPINVPFGTYAQIEEASFGLNTVKFPRSVNVQNVDITLVDNSGRILDLQGLDCELILRVYTTPLEMKF